MPGKADNSFVTGLGGLFSASSSPADEIPDNPDLRKKKKKKKRQFKLQTYGREFDFRGASLYGYGTEREVGTAGYTCQPGGNDKPVGCYRAAHFGDTEQAHYS